MVPDGYGLWLGISLTFWVVALSFLAPLRHRSSAALCAALCAIVGLPLQLWVWSSLMPLFGWPDWAVTPLHLLLAFALFRLCTRLTLPSVLYCAIWTISIHEMGFQIFLAIYGLHRPLGTGEPLGLLSGTLCAASFFVVIGLTVARWMPVRGRYEIGPRQFTGATLSFAVLQLLIIAYGRHWHTVTDWSGWPLPLLLEFYCVTLLYIQHEMFKKSAMRQEIVILNRIQAQQKSQYAAAKENIALLNRKCHDLKHQLAVLRSLDGQRREPYLRELEDVINTYDATVCSTGNQVLDTVLTEKSLHCQANGIQAHCVADGKQLTFLDPVDLYTIFGNALDNAIEHVKTLTEEDRRFIDVMVSRQQQFVMVQIINPAETPPRFDEDGLPLTTKEDKRNHGFGLKSIRQTAQRYGGFLTVGVEDGCFCLRLLFPSPAAP